MVYQNIISLIQVVYMYSKKYSYPKLLALSCVRNVNPIFAIIG